MVAQAIRRSLVAALLAATAAAAAGQERYFILASTTSTEQSGLFGHLLPQFRAATGIEVRVVAVGTGQAFALARRGDADALLVHDPEGERAFVEDGWGAGRHDVMYNDFVVVGPRGDPAGVRSAKTARDAFRRIHDRGGTFASRGDDSGTHRAELRVWRQADLKPKGSWYRELGSGMGATLNTAAAMDAYALTDRATWLSFSNRQGLDLVFAGDPALFNQYGSILISAKRHPHLKHDLAKQWQRWLLSPAGQEAIAGFRIGGASVFVPNAATP